MQEREEPEKARRFGARSLAAAAAVSAISTAIVALDISTPTNTRFLLKCSADLSVRSVRTTLVSIAFRAAQHKIVLSNQASTCVELCPVWLQELDTAGLELAMTFGVLSEVTKLLSLPYS